ncbi:thymidylate synthase [Salmonella phage SeKF_80]|jgi:thymidylate synthase, flavin-dependent|nr:thymidylate synthase [Salmonella phage SE131]AVJ48208.1 thymidylate synthase [Salmonella phage SE131]
MTIEAKLVDVMGNDTSVVNAARVSYGVVREGEMNERDVRLVKFLARERHVTPFRHATITFRCKAPIAIARQLGKHQVGFSWNELSRRYKDGGVEVFKPDVLFKRPDNLHDGSGEAFDKSSVDGTMAHVVFERMCEDAVANYERLLEMGVTPEQARFVLPQGMITEWVWTGSLYGWFEVYRQRSSTHAQYEVRLFAQEIDKELSKLFPIAWESLKATIKDTE